MTSSGLSGQYEVLSPWAEADPKPLRGIAGRLIDLAGKKLGLFCNPKRAAKLILTEVEGKLREEFPTTEISWYFTPTFTVPQIETENRAKFEEWVKGVDAVIAAVGD